MQSKGFDTGFFNRVTFSFCTLVTSSLVGARPTRIQFIRFPNEIKQQNHGQERVRTAMFF